MIAATLRRFGIGCLLAGGVSGLLPVAAADTPNPPAVASASPAEPEFVPSPGGGTVRTAADRRIRAALAKTYDETCEEMPFLRLVFRLEKLLGVRVTIDRRALEDEGIDLDHAMTCDFRGRPFEDALATELAEQHLAAFPLRGTLRITSKARAYGDPSGLLVGSYDVRDLVVRTYSDGVESVEPEPLVKLIEDSCGTDAEWVATGGHSTIRFFTAEGIDSLTVKAPYRTHRAIEELLAALRSQRREGVPPRRRPPPPANPGPGLSCAPMNPAGNGHGSPIGHGSGGFFAVPSPGVPRP